MFFLASAALGVTAAPSGSPTAAVAPTSTDSAPTIREPRTRTAGLLTPRIVCFRESGGPGAVRPRGDRGDRRGVARLHRSRGIADHGVAGGGDRRAAARPRQRRSRAHRLRAGDHEQLHRRGHAHLARCAQWREEALYAYGRRAG